MMAATDRLEFAPPPTPGLMRSFGLAVVAHALLLAALTLGVQWKRDAVNITAEAELWSAVPQQAAPKLIETPAEPAPEPPRPPLVQPEPPAVDIALEREKSRLNMVREQEKQELEKRRLEKQRLEKSKQDKLKQDKREHDNALAEAKKKAEQDAKRKAALKALEEAKQMEAQRQVNIRRMAGLAGATGAPGATGTALQSSGPSASYAGRIRASIKPNIVFTEDITGNPMAEVEVRTAPDGTIISRKLTTSSGVKSWDEAVLKAIDKTHKLPKDVDGRVPGSLIISFKPRD